MSYTALYRQRRPRIFEEVIGQGHITDTLKNQIEADNIAHAYLFSGTRGTGKTSTAKILARAINCLQPDGQNPCNECEICRGMLDESLMDIIEIDAASNNGVDDVRELRENVKYPPAKAKFKVYIIDEVHMLSQGAFNALLKTLEEPPEYVVFILATTEPQKIPATILSRCQRYDFKRISSERLLAHMKAICDSMGVDADDKALSLIARNADGAARDALSILDQCMSFTDGVLTYDVVVDTLGLTTEHWLFSITDGVIDNRASDVMRMVSDMVNDGKNLGHFIKSLTAHYRNLMLSRSGADLGYIMDSTEETIEQTKVQSSRLSMNEILRSIDILTKLEAQSRWATQPRIHLEMALVKLMQPETDQSIEGLLARIERLEAAGPSVQGLERRGASKSAVKDSSSTESKRPGVDEHSEKSAAPGGVNVQDDKPDRSYIEKPAEPTVPSSEEGTFQSEDAELGEEDGGTDVTIGQIQSSWGQILEVVRKTRVQVQAFLIEGTPAYMDGKTLMIAFKDGYFFHMDMINREENRRLVEAAIQKVIGQSVRIRCDFDYNLSVGEEQKPEADVSDEEAVRTYFKDHEDKLEIVD